MAVKTEKELSETQRAHWLKAVAAIELRNFGYAISLLQAILKQEPEFLTARQLLRHSEVTKYRAAKKSFFNISTAPIAVMKAQREMKKDPARAVEMIEKVLEEEPYNKQANLILKEAAVMAGWPETGVFALQTVLEENPSDVKVLHELARLYHDMGLSDAEVETYNKITAVAPLDAEAVRRGKDASARASMTTGGWTQAESYRDLIKDKDAAVSLEQQGRMKLAGDSLDQQIAETYERHQAQPDNVDLARKLGTLNEQKEDFDTALSWYEYASELAGGSDTGLTRKISDLRMRQTDLEIGRQQEFLASHDPNAPGYQEARAQLEAAEAKRGELVIGDARKRVERNPTDLQLRFELGEQLVNAGQFREALPELQRARQHPNARLKAMNLLGRCYQELGNAGPRDEAV